MAKWVCAVCGWTVEQENQPEICPLCKATKFNKMEENAGFACEHHVGDGVVEDAEVTKGLKDHFMGECTEVGMYLAMSRQADREGYPEVAEAYKRIAIEEAEHGATEGKLMLAKRAKELGYDAIHDTVHEMCKDEARHGSAFLGLLNRYFKQSKLYLVDKTKAIQIESLFLFI